jgi:3-oxoacyl-[acyl-carrier-protein] synthase II
MSTDREDGQPRRVVITGIGCITPIGSGPDGLLAGLRRGESAVRRVDWFDVSPFRSQVAAPVDDWDPLDHFDAARVRRLDRYSQFAIGATRMALDDADLDVAAEDPDRVGVQMGTALGGVGYAEEQMGRFVAEGVKGVSPMLALTVYAGAASANIAIEFGFTGPNSTNGMSCASGAVAIGDAWRLIRSGEADRAGAAGWRRRSRRSATAPSPSSAPCPPATTTPPTPRAPSTPAATASSWPRARRCWSGGDGARPRPRRPHLRRAAGLRHHQRRLPHDRPPGGRRPGRPRDAPRRSAPRASRRRIDYVNAHGSSTPLNDSTESRVIRQVLGEHADRVAVSGTKGYTGTPRRDRRHRGLLYPARIRDGWIPPTLNLEEPGPDCDLPTPPARGSAGRSATRSPTPSASAGSTPRWSSGPRRTGIAAPSQRQRAGTFPRIGCYQRGTYRGGPDQPAAGLTFCRPTCIFCGL